MTTKGERREAKSRKNRQMKTSGKGLNQTQQKIISNSAARICNHRWTTKNNHGTGHICAATKDHGGVHECSVCRAIW